MKWYNEDKSKMINLDSVNGYVYIQSKRFIEEHPEEKETVEDFIQHGDRIELIIGGSVFAFRGDDAVAMYNLLREHSSSTLLKG